MHCYKKRYIHSFPLHYLYMSHYIFFNSFFLFFIKSITAKANMINGKNKEVKHLLNNNNIMSDVHYWLKEGSILLHQSISCTLLFRSQRINLSHCKDFIYLFLTMSTYCMKRGGSALYLFFDRKAKHALAQPPCLLQK